MACTSSCAFSWYNTLVGGDETTVCACCVLFDTCSCGWSPRVLDRKVLGRRVTPLALVDVVMHCPVAVDTYEEARDAGGVRHGELHERRPVHIGDLGACAGHEEHHGEAQIVRLHRHHERRVAGLVCGHIRRGMVA
eukprot:Mycagemm_TRINITY_DN10280_c0_g9::TRINITY_DN10280_c0_g9_i1::g.3768::m.3768 type:complete len:136 gc:universal TRINITY_DN10280_c0_g9_i1:51-458(+)